MNDEIKEILRYLRIENGHCSSELSYEETHLLLDYITNLQEENKKIAQQHIYTLDKLIKEQTKTENIIKYIKENGYIDLNGYDLLGILEEKNNE